MRGTKGASVWPRRLKESFAVITIGSGTVELIAPREHSLLLEASPESSRKVPRFFDNPNYVSLLGLTQIGFEAWLAPRQYREE